MSKLVRLANYLPVSKIRRLEIQGRLIDRLYRQDIRRARAKGDGEGVERLKSGHSYELRMIGDERAYAYSRELLRQARRFHLPIPKRVGSDGETTGWWEQSDIDGLWRLSDGGVVHVRKSIRSEMAWRREHRAHWINWIAAVTGLLGALTGLLAVVLR